MARHSTDAAGTASLKGVDVFVSYAREDVALASTLEKGLTRFGKRWTERRALRVFRDSTSLAASGSLWESIEKPLSDARFLVLVASPASAGSDWVCREVEFWLERHPIANLLIVLACGQLDWDPQRCQFSDASDAMAPTLRSRFTAEPRWVDARAERLHVYDSANPDLRAVIAELASPVHGVDRADLDAEDLRQHRRQLGIARTAIVALSLLTLLAAGGGGLAVVARNQALDARRRAQTAQADAEAGADKALLTGLQEQSRNSELRAEQPDLALLLTVEAARRDRSARTLAGFSEVLDELGAFADRGARVTGIWRVGRGVPLEVVTSSSSSWTAVRTTEMTVIRDRTSREEWRSGPSTSVTELSSGEAMVSGSGGLTRVSTGEGRSITKDSWETFGVSAADEPLSAITTDGARLAILDNTNVVQVFDANDPTADSGAQWRLSNRLQGPPNTLGLALSPAGDVVYLADATPAFINVPGEWRVHAISVATGQSRVWAVGHTDRPYFGPRGANWAPRELQFARFSITPDGETLRVAFGTGTRTGDAQELVSGQVVVRTTSEVSSQFTCDNAWRDVSNWFPGSDGEYAIACATRRSDTSGSTIRLYADTDFDNPVVRDVVGGGNQTAVPYTIKVSRVEDSITTSRNEIDLPNAREVVSLSARSPTLFTYVNRDGVVIDVDDNVGTALLPSTKMQVTPNAEYGGLTPRLDLGACYLNTGTRTTPGTPTWDVAVFHARPFDSDRRPNCPRAPLPSKICAVGPTEVVDIANCVDGPSSGSFTKWTQTDGRLTLALAADTYNGVNGAVGTVVRRPVSIVEISLAALPKISIIRTVTLKDPYLIDCGRLTKLFCSVSEDGDVRRVDSNAHHRVIWRIDPKYLPALRSPGSLTRWPSPDPGFVYLRAQDAEVEASIGRLIVIDRQRRAAVMVLRNWQGDPLPVPREWIRAACTLLGRNLTRAEFARYLPGQPYRATCPVRRYRYTPSNDGQ